MADDDNQLGEILGGILAAVAQARRIADEETVSIAEYYRANPLLSGMSVPRVRIPQFDIDIPLLIEEFTQAVDAEPASTEDVLQETVKALQDAAEREGVQLPQTVTNSFSRLLEQRLKAGLTGRGIDRGWTRREALARATESSLREVLQKENKPRFTNNQLKRVYDALRKTAVRVAILKPPVAPGFRVTVVTSKVKDQADPNSVARLRLSVREDGVEWASVENPDGTTRGVLIPE